MKYYERSYIGRKTAGLRSKLIYLRCNKYVKINNFSKYNKNKKYKIYEIINASKYLYNLYFRYEFHDLG